MKTPVQTLKKATQGFTLIELVVVIAILGVLATVLITLIDPIDKTNLANDTASISVIKQLGAANEQYASGQNSGGYSAGMGTTTCTTGAATANSIAATNLFGGAVFDLCGVGENKVGAVVLPTGYVGYYFASANASGLYAACSDTGATKCLGGIFGVGPLKAKKYTAQPYFVVANGKQCTTATVPSSANIGAYC